MLEFIRRHIAGFAALHSLNAAVTLFYSFVQLLVFSRVLPQDRYSEVVFLTAVGLLYLPIDQAIGRSNYVALQEATDRKDGPARCGEVTFVLALQGAFVVALALIVPALMGPASAAAWAENALYLFFCLFTAYWYFDLQATAWGADLGTAFARLSFGWRLGSYGAVALLWATGDFRLFCVVTALVSLAFLALALRLLARRAPAGIFAVDAEVFTAARIRAHAGRLWSALLATVSELIILNATYGLTAMIYGIGSTVVVFDTVMKIARLAMGVDRTLGEILLRRVSARRASGDVAGARKGVLLVIAASLAGNAVLAAVLVAVPKFVFDLFLGPNNVVPTAVGVLAAAIVLIGGLYQPVVLFLGYGNARRAILATTLAAVASFAVYAAVLALAVPDAVGLMATYAAFFLFNAVAALLLFFADLSRDEAAQN